MEFRPMPKTPRLSREIVITEKMKEKPPKAPRDPSKGGRRLIQHRIDFLDRRRV
jgi:hypothetical protein